MFFCSFFTIICNQQKAGITLKIVEKTELFLGIEKLIYSLYQRLPKSKNKEQDLMYLQMVLQYENEFFREAIGSIELSNIFQKHLMRDLMESDIQGKEKQLIQYRVSQYLTDYYYKDPFLSNVQLRRGFQQGNDLFSMVLNEELFGTLEAAENISTISLQCDMDFFRRFLFYSQKELKNKLPVSVRRDIEAYRYNALYSRKILECYLTRDIQEAELTDSSRCLVFNHNEQDVQSLYHNYFVPTALNSVSELMQDCISNKKKSFNSNLILHLLSLRAALDLMNESDQAMIMERLNAYSYFFPDPQSIEKWNMILQKFEEMSQKGSGAEIYEKK